jgi:hypothetical protein
LLCVFAGVQPNILFIIADQWHAQAFAFARGPNVKAPHLDRFEKQCGNYVLGQE